MTLMISVLVEPQSFAEKSAALLILHNCFGNVGTDQRNIHRCTFAKISPFTRAAEPCGLLFALSDRRRPGVRIDNSIKSADWNAKCAVSQKIGNEQALLSMPSDRGIRCSINKRNYGNTGMLV